MASEITATEAIIIGRRGGGAGGKNCLLYGDTDGEAGKFDKLTIPATVTDSPLRYNGEFRATKVFGVYYSDSADLAENYYVYGDDVEAGDLVCVDENGIIRKNTIPGNNKVLGFVSSNPGVVLGDNNTKGYLPIALNGRILVKVEGNCEPGDYLVAGERAGYAVKCENIDTAKRGSIVAMALARKDDSYLTDSVLAFVVRM